MTCVHKVRWSVKRPEYCRFRLSVSHYKDRIVAPDEYTGPTEVTPSDQTQVLATKDKLVRDDITVNPAPTEILSTDHNGTFTPSDGHVGFYQVDVDVNPDLRPLSVNENGSYQPDGFDGYSDVTVNVPSADYTIEELAEGLQPSGAVDLGDTVTVAKHALSYRSALTSVTGSNVTNVQESGFMSSAVESVILPLVTTVGPYAFQACRSLKTVRLPRTNLTTFVFLDASAVEFLFLPSAIGLGMGCFQRCTNLQTVILPAIRSLNTGNVFVGDANLKTIVLGYDSVVDCNASMFGQTPFASGGSGGDIYIPKALYDHLGDGSNLDYLHHTRWNTFNSYGTITWHPIEGSEYETYMPGGEKYEEEMALT